MSLTLTLGVHPRECLIMRFLDRAVRVPAQAPWVFGLYFRRATIAMPLFSLAT